MTWTGLIGIPTAAVLALLLKEKYQDYQQEKMTADIRQFFSQKGDIELVYFDVPQPQSKERNGGLVMSDGRQYSFTYQKGAIIYQEEKMIESKSYEELAQIIEKPEKIVLFFTADWCPDCQFIYPVMPEIEAENADFTFVRVNRDNFMEVAQEWNIFGIPSFVVLENGKEIGRLVNKLRKTKAEINDFLARL